MLYGHVENCTADLVAGWALRTDGETSPVLVDIAIDGQFQARVPANFPRQAHPRQRCGFVVPLPSQIRAGRRRGEISVTFAETGERLGNSPRLVQFARRAKRAICFLAAGHVVNQDDVIAYQTSPHDHIARYTNTGDAMVYDSSLKLLALAELLPINIWSWTDRDVDIWNSEYDYCFLRGSNYVHPDFDWRHFDTLLRKLKLPCIAFSVGAQAPMFRKQELKPEQIEIWKLFADRSATIGVRGDYTAEVFADIGIHNVELIGCPSLFRANDPFLQLNPKPIDAVRKVAFSLRREISEAYTIDVARYLATQKRTILELAQRFDLTITVHGEAAEKVYFYGEEELLPTHQQELIDTGWFQDRNDPMIGIYRDRLFYNETVAQFDALIAQQDLALGFRVHGNLPALAHGVPALCVDYDSRSRELAKHFEIPTISLDELDQEPFDALYSPARFDRFNAAFADNYRRMAEFLDRNGASHNMLRI
ncbi:MAG: polysaccharide pyruvyl transferase family protein [Alphaproteobacteria bacterium]|nr:polysaccharide pyruvyl transferase family protein [Alphaproteobacteria bacterium]